MGEFDAALDALHSGDVARLSRLIDDDPTLVDARAAGETGPYCGYFHRATLLHHVAGNPLIFPLPANVRALAELLLERGASVDAVTSPGPTQPEDIGWTTLGLVASSSEARRAGQQQALMALLLASGASVDARNGGVLMGALYYGEIEAARFLAERGATVDLVAAAGLGAIERASVFVANDGTLASSAHRLVHYSQCKQRPASDQETLDLALVYASMNGHDEVVTWLLDRGARAAARALFDHRATALHWAALRGHGAVVECLLARGADPTLRDETYDGTPRAWAEHAGHADLAAMIPAA
jgi:ankyrin repeat protein